MANGRIRSIPKRLIGRYNKENKTIIKENICILTSRSGKIKPVGGVRLSKET
jgi:hypothetical protein